ncbi:hypothetical protein [Sphingobacterium sp. T2]|nr:hypothetical protein [Sphingobacterium sp. T2]
MGNVQPDWIAGWNNTFTYKNLSVNMLIDARIGQDRYNKHGQSPSIICLP